ncbi:GntR family transcriptional regulator [Bosea sp. (in: a-proteobacteria)]|uniref:GntR family transcriptional regulator n=1 Tax=Bosea sp. (in: a-proteobacteria) TaxID=1871050 RepID=UPI002733D7DC|nr:GntR family transcriptional regulator [Bosea sp. (in: a-proteobacteria)]MDP3410073.1 GntR family transcriptional regulator [Bosea sp. (in: a-proteobacteria)]
MVAKTPASPAFSRLVTLREQPLAYPKSLVELAYEQLLSMLVTMKIAPGAHIGIEALSRDLQISPTPIREALTLLEAQKLAYKIPNVGFRAAELLTRPEIDDLFEMRLLIEPRAAAFAALRSNQQSFDALTTLSEQMARVAGGDETDYALFAEGDARLHHLVASASGNRFIAQTIEGLHVHLHIFRFLFRTNAPERALQEHAAIVSALLARDPDAAEAAMRAHLEASRQRMAAALDHHDDALPGPAGTPPRRIDTGDSHP